VFCFQGELTTVNVSVSVSAAVVVAADDYYCHRWLWWLWWSCGGPVSGGWLPWCNELDSVLVCWCIGVLVCGLHGTVHGSSPDPIPEL